MPRKVSWGTPGRTEHYLRPRGKWALVLPSLGAGAAALLALLLLQAVGVRRPVAPGDLISRHAPLEARCQECHTPRQGASDLRCQRCHDPGGAGRLTNGAHVLFGSGDARKAAAAPAIDCARCHVEHRGRAARLVTVNQLQCAQCHFRSFSGHPEFAVLAGETVETPGIEFGHDSVGPLKFVGHVAEVARVRRISPERSCAECHERSSSERDFSPISFDRHCASCHARDGSLGTIDPVPEEDALPPERIAALGPSEAAMRADEFQAGRGRIGKTIVHHKDPWVVFNLDRLRSEIDPAGRAQERGALLARLSQLQRRLAQATPLASLDGPALAARETTIRSEIRGLEARIAEQPAGASPGDGLSRLDEVRGAASAAGDRVIQAAAEELRAGAEPLRQGSWPATALPPEEFDARRRELLALLDATDAADPALSPRAQDLRRRVLALTAGEPGVDILSRARDQRQAELRRVSDEAVLRASGIAPPAEAMLEPERMALERSIDEVQARLRELSRFPGRAEVPAEELRRKKETFEALTVPCVKCHRFEGAAMRRPAPARPVLSRARFEHRPHVMPVQGDCYHCHASIRRSKVSADLNFAGVQSCRECHRPRGVSQDCLTCHRYHPPSVP